MSTHANMVKMTVTGTPGTGTITLNAASSGYRSFATAYGANATVDILITEGTSWEVARNCTYTHSGTTVTRGTLESSSTGSAVSFTSAAVVSVVATADRGRVWDAAALEHVAGTDAATTMAVNTLYVVPMSAWATASRTYTLPATAAVGDRVGVLVSSGNTTYKLSITAASGDTLNGISGGTEWSALFNASEIVVMRCTVANSTWIIDVDGRFGLMHDVRANGSTTQTLSRNTNTQITTAFATVTNPSGEWNAGTSNYTARRGGTYLVATAIFGGTIQAGQVFLAFLQKNGPVYPANFPAAYAPTGGATMGSGGSIVINMIAGDTLGVYVYYADSTTDRTTNADGNQCYYQFLWLGD